MEEGIKLEIKEKNTNINKEGNKTYPETSRETELKCIKRKRKMPGNPASRKTASEKNKPIRRHYWQRHEGPTLASRITCLGLMTF